MFSCSYCSIVVIIFHSNIIVIPFAICHFDWTCYLKKLWMSELLSDVDLLLNAIGMTYETFQGQHKCVQSIILEWEWSCDVVLGIDKLFVYCEFHCD